MAGPDLSAVSNKSGALKDANGEEESQAMATETKIPEPAPKLSLTIRIPNIKADVPAHSIQLLRRGKRWRPS